MQGDAWAAAAPARGSQVVFLGEVTVKSHLAPTVA